MVKTLAQKENISRSYSLLIGMNANEIKKTLRETAGIWRGRKIDPLRYQRAMRKSYIADTKAK